VFIFIESRAKEPIVPLDLWRNITYASAITATFLISFGFFGAAIFLPQWFQFVQGATPTNSGLYSLALLAGLIFSSIISGQIVARSGRYKPVILVGITVMAIGLFLMSGLKADTPLPLLWVWMFITGVGIGPTLSVFTIVIQNAVPFRQLGVATSNLTFFRQIGGSIGLALLGTVFGNRFAEELIPQMTAAGVPAQLTSQFAAAGAGTGASKFIEVGSDPGQAILAQVPEPFRAAVEPFVSNIVTGLHQAMSVSIGTIFLIGVFTTAAALVVSLFMKEIPLRRHHEAPSAMAQAAAEQRAARNGDAARVPEPASASPARD
jgi:MFS family permease